jgi:hypothetical protein
MDDSSHEQPAIRQTCPSCGQHFKSVAMHQTWGCKAVQDPNSRRSRLGGRVASGSSQPTPRQQQQQQQSADSSRRHSYRAADDSPLAALGGGGGGQVHDDPVELLAATLGTPAYMSDKVAAYPWTRLDGMMSRAVREMWPMGLPQLVRGVWTPDVPSADDLFEACINAIETGQAYSPYELYAGKPGKSLERRKQMITTESFC